MIVCGTSLGWWLHEQRPKHDRRMASAQSHVEKSAFYVREANRYGAGYSVDYAAAAQRSAVKGWEEIEMAVSEVVWCRCPKRLWPESVQEAVDERANA